MSDKEQFNDKKLQEDTKHNPSASNNMKDPRKRVTLWQRKEESQEKEKKRFIYEPVEQNQSNTAAFSQESSHLEEESHFQREKTGLSSDEEKLLERDNVSANIRKNLLRNTILVGGSRPAGMTDEEYCQQKRQKFIKRGVVILLVVVVVAAAFLSNELKQYKTYTVSWQDSDTVGEDVSYLGFQNNFMKCSKDGVSCINQSGQTVWNQSYLMTAPRMVSSENYLAVYDQQGTSIYICDVNGCVGQVTTIRPMTCAVISEQGIVATVQEDTSTGSHYINYYNKDGNQLDVEIKTLLAGNGYPMDIAISPDGQELAASYLYMDNGTMQNQVVFYNFDVGKNESERIVGGFRDYESTMVANIAFLGNESAVAFADNRIDFYSLKNALEPSRKESYTFDRNIKSVFYNNSYAGVVLSAAEGEDEEDSQYELILYNASGNKVFTKNLNFDYSHIALSGDGLIIYNTNKCMVYNMNGRLKYNGTLTGSMEQVVRLSEKNYLVTGNGIVQGITLQ